MSRASFTFDFKPRGLPCCLECSEKAYVFPPLLHMHEFLPVLLLLTHPGVDSGLVLIPPTLCELYCGPLNTRKHCHIATSEKA